MRFTFWPTIDRAAMTAGWKSLWYDESGQDLIEYALVACLVALAAIASIKTFGAKLNTMFTSVSTSVTGSI